MRSSHILQVFIEQTYSAFAEKPDKFFWARLREKTFAFAGKRLEHLESKKILCGHRPKTLNVSTGPQTKTLMGRIHCLYNNVTSRLYAAEN